jgi:poly(3-hydroxybutyrate) depolymerase
MNPAAAALDPPDAVLLWARTQQFAAQGLIDDVANLRHQRVFLFSGAKDELVTSTVMDQTHNFYDFAHAAQVTFIGDVPSGHGMITARSSDSACDANLPPYFNNCQRGLAGELLAALYDNIVAPAPGRPAGRIVRFNQRAFAPAGSGLAPEAFVFVPTGCNSGGCRVHVAFHGCFQSVRAVQDHFYRYAGYNETAATNRIVVLYPQIEATNFPYNPLACWDYWGYSGAHWYARDGVQVAAIHRMLMRLAQPRNRIAVRK